MGPVVDSTGSLFWVIGPVVQDKELLALLILLNPVAQIISAVNVTDNCCGP